MISGVVLFRLRNRSSEKDTGERTLGLCAERFVEKHCFAVPASHLPSEVTDEDEKVWQLR